MYYCMTGRAIPFKMIPKSRTEHFPLLPDPRNCKSIYCKNSASLYIDMGVSIGMSNNEQAIRGNIAL